MGEKSTDLDFIRALTRKLSHVEVAPESDHLILAGLEITRQRLRVRSKSELMRRVRQDPSGPDATELVESLTVNETRFFRDHHAWCALRESVLPNVITERRPQRALKIWSAAAASGQEAYSLAIMLIDDFPELATWDIQILATDISHVMVDRVDAGIYSEGEIARGLSPDQRDRHFRKAEEGWQVSSQLRQMVSPEHLNLALANGSSEKFDLILARNILMYFGRENKHKLLTQLEARMNPWTALLLGGGETTVNLHAGFRAVDCCHFRYFTTGPGLPQCGATRCHPRGE